MKKHLISRKGAVLGLLVIVVAAFILSFGETLLYRLRYSDPGQRELKQITDRIGKIIALPEGEEPSLATVSDKTKVAKGGVLKNAENGDKVILYYQTLKAYLYRPSLGKVIDSGPIVLDPSANEVAGSKIVIRQGTADDQKAENIKNTLNGRYKDISIEPIGKAVRADYPVTIIIDLTTGGQKTSFVESMAELLGAQRGVLPIAEPRPEDKDILIIVGNN